MWEMPLFFINPKINPKNKEGKNLAIYLQLTVKPSHMYNGYACGAVPTRYRDSTRRV